MHILIVNPNTSTSLTERMERAARCQIPADVTLSSRTAPRGFPYISNRAEAQVAGSVTLEMLARQGTGTDAAIVAAFGDPGARAARDLRPFPVIGVAEAAMHSAAMLGERFGILAFSRQMQGWYRDCVHQVGLERRFAGFRAPAVAPRSPDTAQEDLHDALLDCLRDCQDRDGADVVIVAGAPLAGFATLAAGETRLPLVDPVIAALHQAVALSRLAARRGRHERDDPKPSTGLDPELAALFLAGSPHPRANGRAGGNP
ncbi:aspartate/glutamate racemase family protein [Paracoccus sp. (in: a-proteobacteria)]|uniref:aspartate/glutamate racemase family protein n=1 Tax=Paracoccus sp. TaxID=267 RepID=UPI00272C4980|nr:aspartate/glutamate racemase family protein [Paracoccus sp. (in: a-proteobacteria)]